MFDFLLRHGLNGILIGILVGQGLIWMDVASLRTLTEGSEDGLLARLLLYFGLAVTFGSASMGTAIMAIGFDEDPRG